MEAQGSIAVLGRGCAARKALPFPETGRGGGSGYLILGGVVAQRRIREWTWGRLKNLGNFLGNVGSEKSS